MKNLKTFIVCAGLSFFGGASSVFAHGEDKPGPHGGIVRMPSGFHSEIIPINSRSFKVYLLDFHFKDPVVRNSKVEGTVETDGGVFPVTCQPKSDYYECGIEGTRSLSTGDLKLNTMRDGMSGAQMTYGLPLQLPQSHGEHTHAQGGEK